MPVHATAPERDLDPGFGESRLADVPNRPVDSILANLLADQGSVRPDAGFSPMSDCPGTDAKRKAALQDEPV